MALSLGGARRRWVCRVACRGGKGRARAGCRHFHVHYHFPRQVCAFSPLRLLPRFSLLPYLLILPVLFFAVLAFLVLFGWFTLVYFVSSLFGEGNHHECCNDPASHSNELCRADEQEGQREDKCVAESTCDSAMREVCAERYEIKEVFVDGLFDDSREISGMASPDACNNCGERSSDGKSVEEVMIVETKWKDLKEISELDASSEKQELQDTSIDWFVEEHDNRDWFVEEHDNRELSTSHTTAKLFDVQYSEYLVASRKELTSYSSSQFFELIDNHETREVLVTSPYDSTYVKSVPEDIFDEQEIIQKMVTHHKNMLPEDDFMEENGKQFVGISDQTHDLNDYSETSWLPLESVENKFATGSASNALFHCTNAVEDAEREEEFTESNKVEESGSISLFCDFPENHRAIRAEIGSFATEDNIHEVASRESSVTERTEDEDENSNDSCTSKGASSRLPLVRRSPPPWWNLCGVLDVFAGCEDKI